MANMSDALIHFATHRFHRLVLSDAIGEHKANTYSAVFAAALTFQNCILSTGCLLQACLLDTCSFHDVTFLIILFKFIKYDEHHRKSHSAQSEVKGLTHGHSIENAFSGISYSMRTTCVQRPLEQAANSHCPLSCHLCAATPTPQYPATPTQGPEGV